MIRGLQKLGYLLIHTLDTTGRVGTLEGLYCREEVPSLCGVGQVLLVPWLDKAKSDTRGTKENTYVDKYLVHLTTSCQFYVNICACDSYMILENIMNTNMGIDSLLGV